MKKAAIYTRYSTDKQTENSTAFQIEACKRFCSKKKYQVFDSYSDEEFSGTNLDRPEFLRLMNDAKDNLFDVVVFYDLSRGSRDIIDWFSFRKEMKKLGIEVESVHDKVGDILDPSNFLTELITIGLGQHHVLQSRQKSIDGKYAKARQGLFMGGKPPIGYDIIDRRYVINRKEAEGVQAVFDMYLKNEKMTVIAKTLEEMGVRSKKGSKIRMWSLYDILRNEKYTGTFVWAAKNNREMTKWVGKKNPEEKIVRIPDAIPQIITKEQFEKAQKLLKARSRKTTTSSNRKYILSGKITCPKCGAPYYGVSNKSGKGFVTVSYVCSNKIKHKCSSFNLPAEIMEKKVMQAIKSWVVRSGLDNLVDYIYDKKKSASSLKDSKTELAKVNSELHNLVETLKRGIVIEELEEEIKLLKQRQGVLKERIERIEKSIHNMDDLKIGIKKSIMTRLNSPSKTAQASLVNDYVKKITPLKHDLIALEVGVVSYSWLPR